MDVESFSIKKVAEIFGGGHLKDKLLELEDKGLIPPLEKFSSGALFRKGWDSRALPQIGEKVGLFPKFQRPVSICVFTTKGGVLKSTLSLNMARFSALHNLKTCVIGLDIQGDVTTALGYESDLEEKDDLREILGRLDQTKGVADFFNGQEKLTEIICPTDLPSLFLIPETPELAAMNDLLNNINRREFWFKEKVIDPLKEFFDLIVIDCSPNWNKLTTNALVSCDVLLSPLECKINNFRNFRVFRQFLEEFKDEMRLDFESIFIPTRFSTNRKLGLEIKKWYQSHLKECTKGGMRESVAGEEATALYRSLIEHRPRKKEAIEMRELLYEMRERIESFLSRTKEFANQGQDRGREFPLGPPGHKQEHEHRHSHGHNRQGLGPSWP